MTEASSRVIDRRERGANEGWLVWDDSRRDNGAARDTLWLMDNGEHIDAPEWLPFDPEEDAAQQAAVIELLGSLGFSADRPARVLDLGCGGGRMLAPILAAGHQVVGIDSNPDSIRACRRRMEIQGESSGAELILHDFTAATELPRPHDVACYDLALCVGHTWMQIADPIVAIGVVQRIGRALSSRGVFVIDNLPGSLWPLVAAGDWITGVSEDGASQFIWAADDNVFAVREGDAVDLDDQELRPADRRYRLWTMGELRLLALAGGFDPPRADRSALLLTFARSAESLNVDGQDV